MTKKYIIKNCQCIYIDYKGTYECDYKVEFCENVTDCLLKQIAKECKWETGIDVNDRGDLAERVLSMLEIQECE